MENEPRNLTIGTLIRVDRKAEIKLVRRKGVKPGRRAKGGESRSTLPEIAIQHTTVYYALL